MSIELENIQLLKVNFQISDQKPLNQYTSFLLPQKPLNEIKTSVPHQKQLNQITSSLPLLKAIYEIKTSVPDQKQLKVEVSLPAIKLLSVPAHDHHSYAKSCDIEKDKRPITSYFNIIGIKTSSTRDALYMECTKKQTLITDYFHPSVPAVETVHDSVNVQLATNKFLEGALSHM